jgi:hypothetical protein
METVFDIATPEELEALFGEDDPELQDLRNHSDMRRRALENPDFNNFDLACLYELRGDMQKFEYYRLQIRDPERAVCLDRAFYHFDGPRPSS